MFNEKIHINGMFNRIIWDEMFKSPWGWNISNTWYDPRTHDITPKRETLVAEVEKEKGLQTALEEAEKKYIKKIAELISESKQREKELEEKLK